MRNKYCIPAQFNHLFASVMLLVLVGLTTCQPSNPNTPNEGGEIQEKPATEKNGTTEMISMLNEIHNSTRPMDVAYFKNSERAKFYKNIMEGSTKPKKQLNGQLFYGLESLNAGHSENAILVFEDLLQKATQLGLEQSEIYYQILRLLALSYVRLGEQNNCINRYNPARCIMPFEGEGVYEIEVSVRTAIQHYETILAANPDDYESIWMLNFSYMAIGGYPDKVPPKWRLSEREFQSDYQIPRFNNIASKLGLNTVGLAGGVCVDDFNNDGLLDIFVSSWGMSDQLRFFVNNGDGSFSDQTARSGLNGLFGGLNMLHADYDNDGHLDILVLRGAWFEKSGEIPNSLIRNNGDGTFTDVTIQTGLLSKAPTQAAVWADFNKDGWLDLFIGNESKKPALKYPCELYVNNGDGTFSNKIDVSGLQNIFAMIKGVAAGDVNNDGWPDLYISFLDAPNRLFLNQGFRGGELVSFADAPKMAQVGEPVSSFPCWFWDFDNDGREDIFVASYGFENTGSRLKASAVAAQNYLGKHAGAEPKIYKNKGDGSFVEMGKSLGLTDGLFAMGANFGDIDNDGYLDFYLGTGTPTFSSVVPNKMFRNNKGKTFQDVTTAGGLGHVQKGHGVGFGDFDNDGDQDIFCVIGGAYEGDIFGDAFFLNPSDGTASWVTLSLEGVASNRSAIGARVKITAVDATGEKRHYHRTVSTGGSFGANSLQLEVGLGNATSIEEVEVHWPNSSSTVEVFKNINLRSFVKIKEGSGQAVYLSKKKIVFPS